MTRRRRAVPWVLAVAAGSVQAHGAMTSGHLVWLGAILLGAALMLGLPERATVRAAMLRGLGIGGLAGLVAGAHQWGIGYYALSVYAVAAGYAALAWGAYSAVVMVLLARTGAWALPACGALWALVEVGRSIGAFAYPFFFGAMLADETIVAQTASVVGSSGLSGFIYWIGFALGGVLAVAFGDRRFVGRWFGAPAGAALLAAAAFGIWRLQTAPSPSERIRVSALQGSVPSWLYTLASGPGPYQRIIEEQYSFLFREALKENPRLVFFPETTFNWQVKPTTEGIRRISTFSANRLPPDLGLVFGASFSNMHTGGATRNGVAIAVPDHTHLPRLRGIISKRQLVPFIEVSHEAAQRWALAELHGYRFGVMVCFESMHPQAGLFAARNGARFLSIVSDDAGMRRAPIAWTHSQQGRMRAVEVGLPLIRAGQVGQTYVIDAFGRSIGEVEAWEVGSLTVELPLHDVPTVFRRVGLWWALVWALLAFGPLVTSVVVRRTESA